MKSSPLSSSGGPSPLPHHPKFPLVSELFLCFCAQGKSFFLAIVTASHVQHARLLVASFCRSSIHTNAKHGCSRVTKSQVCSRSHIKNNICHMSINPGTLQMLFMHIMLYAPLHLYKLRSPIDMTADAHICG